MSTKKKRNEKPVDTSQQRGLFINVRAGDHNKVKRFVKDRVVDVNEADHDDPRGVTAIILASELGDVEMVKLLMKAQPKAADVNAETVTGRRAIWWAAKIGNKELADQLLTDTTCEVNYIDRETGCSPLYRAILTNKADVVRAILHAGGDVNLRKLGLSKGAETPLIKSVQMDNIEICEMLINSLCEKNTKTDDGLTALHYAVAYRRYAICRLLLQEMVKIHARSNSGVTALTVAIEQHNPAMVKILIENGYRLDRPYRWGEMPIQQAIALHSQECAMTLAYWGCDLTQPAALKNSKKRKPFSAFYLAVNERLMSLARLLIDLHPWFLREEWLWEKDWPVSLYRRPLVRRWLKEQASTPRSLKSLCRSRIFRCLGLYAPHKAEQLPLPESLKRYLTFPEHIKDKFYEEIPLSQEGCPYDCEVACPLRTCPVVDISFSDDSDQDIEIW
ncbi:putative ankyrin repeat protein RF_0381 [Littorina saxatilis]|uniref:SOCS box domain-containing protein n=1 Tax=Littorina saxatilis TaxID=31220 RepID=A0AAN9GNS3_9CAEN